LVGAGARRQAVVLAVVTAIAAPGGTSAAGGTPSLRGAMEEAVGLLLSDLFAARTVGEVISVEPTGDFVGQFPAAAAPADAEYLVVRPPATPGQDFAETLGVARIVEARDQSVLARLAWSHGRPARGDHLVWPARITVILARTDPGDRPDLEAPARRLDHWLELQLVSDRRLRVLRADTRAAEEARAEQLRKEREYGLVVAPMLLSAPEGVEVVLRVRSAFTGQTLAKRLPFVSAEFLRGDSDPFDDDLNGFVSPSTPNGLRPGDFPFLRKTVLNLGSPALGDGTADFGFALDGRGIGATIGNILEGSTFNSAGHSVRFHRTEPIEAEFRSFGIGDVPSTIWGGLDLLLVYKPQPQYQFRPFFSVFFPGSGAEKIAGADDAAIAGGVGFFAAF